MSESAIEQRLRRFCAVKKSGVCEAGEEALKMFKDLEKRKELTEMFKQVNLSKAGGCACAPVQCETSHKYCSGQPELKRLVTETRTEEAKDSSKLTTKSGYYTEREMKTLLKMTKHISCICFPLNNFSFMRMCSLLSPVKLEE